MTICSICQDDINTGNYSLNCGHVFHLECALNYYRSMNDTRCPNCRGEPRNSLRGRVDRIKQYKKVSRRKYCPKLIKDRCNRLKNSNIKILEIRREYKKFVNQHKEILKQNEKIKQKLLYVKRDKYNAEIHLDSIPVLLLVQQLNK